MAPAAAQLLEISPSLSYYIAPGSEREARHIHKEIFLDHCYDIPSSPLPSSPFIIDAGANIGLFSLYTAQRYPTANILAFEPAPHTHALLRRNIDLHNLGDRITTHQVGLSDEDTTLPFTFYATAPGNSTLFPDQKSGLRDLVVKKYPEHGEAIMKQWLGGEQTLEIQVKRLSAFLREVERVDLLKVDVEGAELHLLRGVGERGWDKIQRVVLEVSEIGNEGARARVKGLLEEKGLVVVGEEAAHPEFGEHLVVMKAVRVE